MRTRALRCSGPSVPGRPLAGVCLDFQGVAGYPSGPFTTGARSRCTQSSAGGKQYRVAEGDVVRIEKVPGEVGTEITFAEVLWLGGTESPKAGRPLVEGAKVVGKILAQDRYRRVLHFRKEKEGWTRRKGHRQPYTEVKVVSVAG